MKKFLIALNLVIWSFVGYQVTAFAADPAKKDVAAVQNDNCVKKDKNGKCPPLPKSEKPTPKKKVEDKK
jgi:hypothetical protein